MLASFLGVLVILNVHYRSVAPRGRKTLGFTVRCIGVVLWPLFITAICPSCPHIQTGTVWMFLLEVLNSVLLMDPASRKGIHMERGPFLAVVFALTAMCGNRPDSKHCNLFVYTVLIMFLAVLPSHDLDKNSTSAIILENVQQVILHYCIAMFVTAVSLTCKKSIN